MTKLSLSPYFHPTTVVLVDDNEAFLHSLALEMPAAMAFHGFSNADSALDFMNEPCDLPPLVDRCFTLDRKNDTEAVIRLDLGLIEQEIKHLERFRRVSVVLVDYAMPYVDGLEFCERLRDPYARRALFTGVADEKLAVEAFNAGLIHRYLPKQAATAAEAVIAFIGELEREYFNQYLARLKTTLALSPPAVLVDPEIAIRVQQLMHDERVAEYYLVNDPPGFLMLRANGSVIRLVLLDDADRQRQIDLVRRCGAPPEIRRGIERGELIGLFSGENPEDYYGEEGFPWAEHVVPGRKLNSARNWLEAVVHDAATDIDFDPTVSSYDTYLARLRRR